MRDDEDAILTTLAVSPEMTVSSIIARTWISNSGEIRPDNQWDNGEQCA